MSYQIVTDATSDLTPALLAGLPPLAVVPMPVNIDGEPHSFGPGGDLEVDSFYGILRSGSFGSTSMINPATYMEVFEPILQQGMDLVYLGFSSGLSGTYQGALLCMEELREKYPQRTLCYVDTLSASIGEGQLILGALRQQQAGLALDALVEWVEAHRLGMCHLFMVDTFEHLRRGGPRFCSRSGGRHCPTDQAHALCGRQGAFRGQRQAPGPETGHPTAAGSVCQPIRSPGGRHGICGPRGLPGGSPGPQGGCSVAPSRNNGAHFLRWPCDRLPHRPRYPGPHLFRQDPGSPQRLIPVFVPLSFLCSLGRRLASFFCGAG